MTRRYGHTISITTATATATTAVTTIAGSAGTSGASGPSGEPPTGIRWNGVAYRVVEVLGAWHLCDRWWETGKTGEQVSPLQQPALDYTRGHAPDHGREPTAGASDRYYYRLRCASGLICEIYHDQVSDAWVLDCVYD